MSILRILLKRHTSYDNPASLGSRLRSKRIQPLLQMIDAVYKTKGAVRMIDLGGTDIYWNIVPAQYLSDRNVTITIVNLPGSDMPADHGPFRFIEADACELTDIPDNSFDISHSNSVLEHVGDWDRMVRFAYHLRRISTSYFCQTPNYWFPLEPHFMTPLIHWFPRPVRLWLFMHISLGHWRKATSVDQAMRTVDSARLLNKQMLRTLFPEATIITERLFLLPKSFIAIRTHH